MVNPTSQQFTWWVKFYHILSYIWHLWKLSRQTFHEICADLSVITASITGDCKTSPQNKFFAKQLSTRWSGIWRQHIQQSPAWPSKCFYFFFSSIQILLLINHKWVGRRNPIGSATSSDVSEMNSDGRWGGFRLQSVQNRLRKNLDESKQGLLDRRLNPAINSLVICAKFSVFKVVKVTVSKMVILWYGCLMINTNKNSKTWEWIHIYCSICLYYCILQRFGCYQALKNVKSVTFTALALIIRCYIQ